MQNDYSLRYLPMFYDDLDEKISYIASALTFM